MNWNLVATDVRMALADLYGPRWRTWPVLPDGVDAPGGRNSELDFDIARNHLRDDGFVAALDRAGASDLPAWEIAARVWAPDGVVVEPLLPILRSTSDAILAVDPAIGARAGLDALLVLIATAHESLQEAHGDPVADPIGLAHQWMGIELLCGAVIARAIAAAGTRVTEHFESWDILGNQHAPGGIDYVHQIALSAMRYLNWQQDGACQCRRGCARAAHVLRRWGPKANKSDSGGGGTQELGQWFWALMIGPQLPEKLRPKTFEENLFYRDFLLRLTSPPVDLRVEETLGEICAEAGCPSLTAGRNKKDEPVAVRAKRCGPDRRGEVGVGTRQCCVDPSHRLRYQPGRLRDFVVQTYRYTTHGYFSPLRYDDARSSWVVGGRAERWLILPLGTAHESLVAASAPARPERHIVPWRREAAYLEAEAPRAIDPRVIALAMEMRERESDDEDDSDAFIRHLIHRAREEGLAAPRADCDNESCRELSGGESPDLPFCLCAFFEEFRDAWAATDPGRA